MRSTHFPLLKDRGTLTLPTGRWLIQEYYPQYPKRDFLIVSVQNRDTLLSMSFASGDAFESWLEVNCQPVQLPLL
jgi:hypothetical protein